MTEIDAGNFSSGAVVNERFGQISLAVFCDFQMAIRQVVANRYPLFRRVFCGKGNHRISANQIVINAE
ncbi:hypothetical protein [Parachitinimonas caeni]|uniref:Uncharacterized protein n=1 Tax=Parachitinimonas caeni TaxID=3031301 RepID=A0ABT7DV15_9NEIS|nr:hypothetical protein [Parachitinimonas caeni]MDK2123916.1 hypothetical protein [Parachitinimonas caeni]